MTLPVCGVLSLWFYFTAVTSWNFALNRLRGREQTASQSFFCLVQGHCFWLLMSSRSWNPCSWSRNMKQNVHFSCSLSDYIFSVEWSYVNDGLVFPQSGLRAHYWISENELRFTRIMNWSYLYTRALACYTHISESVLFINLRFFGKITRITKALANSHLT